jgi:hypothetical protein
MLASGKSHKEVIRPDFNRAIMIDFQGAQITSNVGFLLLREIDNRFRIIDPMGDCLEDLRSPIHTKHSLVQMVRQRVYQIAAGYEDGNDAEFLRIDPALRLAIGKDHKVGAGQSMLSRLENDVLGNAVGIEALNAALTRSSDALLRRKNKRRLIIDVDSTEDPVHGKQEGGLTTVILVRTASIPFLAIDWYVGTLGEKLTSYKILCYRLPTSWVARFSVLT